MGLDFMELKERFTHRPLVPDELAKQQSTWRQRWKLPPRPTHSSSTNWAYYIDPTKGQARPKDQRLRLRFALLNDADQNKYFVTGSKGAGKSTAAHALWQDDKIKERFCLLGCSVADYLNLADLEASQVLAVMIAHLVEAIRDAKPDADLMIPEAKEALEALDKVLKETRPGAKLAGVNINLFGFLTAQFKESESARTAYSTFMDGHFDEVMSLFDRLVDILEGYRQKKVLFIIDDLDKVGAFEINQNVFQLGMPMLLRPRCAVVYTFPLELLHDPRFDRVKAEVNRFIIGNVKLIDRPDGAVLDDGRDILREFIRCRLDDELDTYFDTQLLDKVFVYACGNFRLLCYILQHAFQTAAMLERERVDRECLEIALSQLRMDYNPILQGYRGALKIVRDNVVSDEPKEIEPETRSRLIQSLAVVEYPNDPGWLDVHPVLKDLMDGKPSVL